jgi:hypothetical protein
MKTAIVWKITPRVSLWLDQRGNGNRGAVKAEQEAWRQSRGGWRALVLWITKAVEIRFGLVVSEVWLGERSHRVIRWIMQ